MLKDYLSVNDIADILNVSECSAKEMLNGIIELEEYEVYLLSKEKSVTIDQLLK